MAIRWQRPASPISRQSDIWPKLFAKYLSLVPSPSQIQSGQMLNGRKINVMRGLNAPKRETKSRKNFDGPQKQTARIGAITLIRNVTEMFIRQHLDGRVSRRSTWFQSSKWSS
jgi:hypothetical protein